MEPEYVLDDNQRKCLCGYTTREKDSFWVDTYAVWHIICYKCGCEWVE